MAATQEPWLSKLNAGDSQTAWDLFSERYRRLMLATIRRLVGDDDDVMDVFSSVCHALIDNDFARLKAYSAQRDRPATVATWLVAVVRNQTVDWLRRRDGRRPRPTSEPKWGAWPIRPSEPATPESDPAEVSESARVLAGALAMQPVDVQLAVQLFVVEGMSAADVAEAVNWPNAKAVYNRVYRALEAVRSELERQGIGRGDL